MEAEERRPPPRPPPLHLLPEDWQGARSLDVHRVPFSFVTFAYPATSRPQAAALSNPISAAFAYPAPCPFPLLSQLES